ncbi:hypothetical protein Tco_0405317 [Tanacetum coccineum]
MRPAQALKVIQTIDDHSKKWHDRTTSRNVESSSSKDGLADLVNKLENLGQDIKKLKENVHSIMSRNKGGRQILAEPVKKYIEEGSMRQVTTLAKEAMAKTDKNEDCKAIFSNGASLYTSFYYSREEIEYFLANSGFSDDDESKNITSIPDEDLKQTSPKQTTTHYIELYVPPIPFPRRLEQHAEEVLIHKTMESLKKIKANRPFLKEIRQSDEYPKFMKDLVANKPLIVENKDVIINRRCLALLLNQLPPKEKDPGSFILPCSIRRLDFNNALADLRASISIMPFSMYKRLGIGKLETIKMNIELADNSKCIPKGIVRNLLIKVDKFILPIDFIVLDVLKDFRMPVILGRPLLVTAHAKVDVLKKSISLKVGNEKVIFKMKNGLPDIRNEPVLMIKSNMIAEEDELMNIKSYLFTYTTNTCESCQILAVDTDLFTYEKILTEHWRKRFGVDYDDSDDFYDLDQCGDGRNNEIRERIIHNLHKEWFNGTSDDEEIIEGIIDYLEPTSYDGFVDLDEEEYNKRDILGPGEVYTKLEVSNTKELPRTMNNVAIIRSDIMEENTRSKAGNYIETAGPDVISCGNFAEFSTVMA